MPKKQLDFRSKQRFLSDILHNHFQSKMHYDTRANWMLGISAVIMSISLTQLKESVYRTNIGFVIIFLSALVSFLFSLLIISVPPFVRRDDKDKRAKTLMYFKSFKHMSAKEYADYLKNINHPDDIIDNYAADIMNLVKRSIVIKSKLIKWPVYILFCGVLIGSIFILII
ncbi:hypothetical protein KY348_02265 [Candidatus Woesearchaeota archaeon]|nr:hypothetical protein [Candidatus Woesearchaeota archaeon]